MSVTAVPLHPLSKGTVAKFWIGLLLVVLLGIGLAWIGTSSQQYETAENGIRLRVLEAGSGDPATPEDLALLHVDTRLPSGEVQSTRQSGQPSPLSAESAPAWLREYLLRMREGGVYQLIVPVPVVLEGQPAPPGVDMQPDDSLEFRFQVVRIERGGVAQQRQQMMQQRMMQQQMMEEMMSKQGGGAGAPGAGPGAPGSAPPPAGPGPR